MQKQRSESDVGKHCASAATFFAERILWNIVTLLCVWHCLFRHCVHVVVYRLYTLINQEICLTVYFLTISR